MNCLNASEIELINWLKLLKNKLTRNSVAEILFYAIVKVRKEYNQVKAFNFYFAFPRYCTI